MYCSNCGKKIQDEAKYCMYCGTKVVQQEIEEDIKEEVQEEKVEPVKVEAEVVEGTTSESINEEVKEEKIDSNEYEVKTDNNTVTIEPKKDKSGYLSTVLIINFILLAFKVLSAIFMVIAMNTNEFYRALLGTSRYYGIYSVDLIKFVVYALLVISIGFTLAITLFEFFGKKKENKSNIIVAFILTCVKYAYMSFMFIVMMMSGFTFVGVIIVAIAVVIIILTYKALQEAKEKFN